MWVILVPHYRSLFNLRKSITYRVDMIYSDGNRRGPLGQWAPSFPVGPELFRVGGQLAPIFYRCFIKDDQIWLPTIYFGPHFSEFGANLPPTFALLFPTMMICITWYISSVAATDQFRWGWHRVPNSWLGGAHPLPPCLHHWQTQFHPKFRKGGLGGLAAD